MALAALVACAQPQDGNRRDVDLVVLWPRDVQEIDPRFTGDAYGMKLSRLLFASLITIDPDSLEAVPDLAQSVELLSPTEIRVRLRDGLRFSDGSVLDAEDVVATYRSVVAPGFGSRYAATYRRIRRVETIDPRTVVFHLNGPHAPFLTDLELPILRAEDEHRHLGTLGSAPPSGSGSHVLVERIAGRIELAPNPHWYRGKPRFADVRLLVIRDDNTRALRLLSRAGDLALNAVPNLLVPLFEDKPGFAVRARPGTGTTYLGMHTEASVLRDPRVRKAIAHAIDREALVRAKLGGRGRVATSFIAPGHWAHASDLPRYAYDPAQASALLDEAGLPRPSEGPRLRLTLRCGSDRHRTSIARAIAAMLGRVGIDVDVRPSEIATLIADLDRGRFELTTLQLPELIEPHVLSWFFGSNRIPGEGVEGANRWRLRDAALDAALERGRRTNERSARIAAYREVQQRLAETLPALPLWHEDQVAIVGPRAEGFRVPRDGRYATLAR